MRERGFEAFPNPESRFLSPESNNTVFLRGLGGPAGKTQPQLQQFVPHVAARKPLDHAIDARRMDQRGLDLRRRESPDVALDQFLARPPDARVAHGLLQRPAAGKPRQHAADSADLLGDRP